VEKHLVSIIIPAYNRASLIGETLDSVLKQTYSNWECIIVDDGSTDNTVEVIRMYAAKDERFKLFLRPVCRPKGANACRNYGFEKSKGEYINWFDCDDILKSDFLEKKVELFRKRKGIDAVFSYGAYFNANNNIIDSSKPKKKYSDIFDYVSNQFHLSTPGPLWHRNFLSNKTLFDEERQKIQDVEFHFRMFLYQFRFDSYEQDYLFLIRRGFDRISSKKTLSTKKIEDVFTYNYFTYASSDIVNTKYLDRYKKITALNTLKAFYEIMVYQKSIRNRYKIFKKYKSEIKKVTSEMKNGFSDSVKINLFLILSVTIKKGFSLLNK